MNPEKWALIVRGMVWAEAGRERGEPAGGPVAGDAAQHFRVGEALAAMGDVRGALLEYDEALRLDGGHSAARGARGGLRATLGNLSGALGDFDEMVRREPENARAYFLRGGCHLMAKRFSQAGEDLEMAARLDASLSPAIYGLIADGLGLSFPEEGGRMKKAGEYEICLTGYESILPELAGIIAADYDPGAFDEAGEAFRAWGQLKQEWTLRGKRGYLVVLLEKYEGYFVAWFWAEAPHFEKGKALLWQGYLACGGDPNAQEKP